MLGTKTIHCSWQTSNWNLKQSGLEFSKGLVALKHTHKSKQVVKCGIETERKKKDKTISFIKNLLGASVLPWGRIWFLDATQIYGGSHYVKPGVPQWYGRKRKARVGHVLWELLWCDCWVDSLLTRDFLWKFFSVTTDCDKSTKEINSAWTLAVTRTTETWIAYDNSAWHAINTGYRNSAKETFS